MDKAGLFHDPDYYGINTVYIAGYITSTFLNLLNKLMYEKK